MPLWRCPHCGTPQAETARCWVCRRSSTTCSTCRNFRRSVAGQLGYCGLDRRRLPLAGTELRGCWEPGSPRIADASGVAIGGRPLPERDETGDEPPSPALRLRDFVPVELASHRVAGRGPRPAPLPLPTDSQATVPTSREPVPPRAWEERVTLFADAEL